MRICQIALQNFRGIRQGRIVLPGHSVLLGANNVGKTTIVEAMALLFAREGMVRPISEWDFYGGSLKPDTRFDIIATITEFPDNDPTAVPDWFVGENAARPVWWHDDASYLSTETDPPSGTLLAAQVAMTGRYDDETCEVETIRYFYDGERDPFTDGCSPVSSRLLRQVGLFLLSSNRQWDKLLSFGSSSLLKVIREYEALPGKAIEDLKKQLRDDVSKIEEANPLADILENAANELRSFLLVEESSRLVYRPTSLDAVSVLQSLVAHVQKPDDSLIPIARHGAGLISLQAFLLLLAFAERRKATGKNFILAAEEPELHLHPSLHQRLVHRIRSASTQSIVTTQSPGVAAAYQPNEVVFLKNASGNMEAPRLRTEPIKSIKSNSIRNLYLVRRPAFYEALMGGIVLVPEGMYDFEWLCLWQRLAQSSPGSTDLFRLTPIAVLPTFDGAIVDTFEEVRRFRPDAIPLVDGDCQGDEHVSRLSTIEPPPLKIVRYGKCAAVECLSAWVLEPALANPGTALQMLLPHAGGRDLKHLQVALIEKKKDRELRETIVWESLHTSACCERACEFFHDLAAIARGESDSLKNTSWRTETPVNGCLVFTASHIRRA